MNLEEIRTETKSDLDGMTREELIAEVKRLRQKTFSEPERPAEYAKIVAFSILAACVYGIAHDLVTAHVCVEYFLPPVHPIIVPTASPLLLALVWGIVATWWVGLFLGIPLAVVCRWGSKPKLTVKDVVRPVLVLLVVLYVVSMLFGGIGYFMRWSGLRLIPSSFEKHIASELHASLQFNLFAHNVAYLFGTVCGLVLMFRLWKKRQILAFSIHHNLPA